MPYVSIVGLDLSLTHTAGLHAAGELDLSAPLASAQALATRAFTVQSEKRDHAHAVERLASLRDQLRAELEQCAESSDPGLCIVEGYAMGARNGRETAGEWGGQARLLAWERGWTLLVVPPSTLKAFVCGKGNAPKELMLREVFRRWGYVAAENNDADAYALVQFGLAWTGWRENGPASKATARLFAKLEAWEPRRAA